MARSFIATCLSCGANRRVRRFELLRAARPRCLRCGGAIELSQAAQDDLANVQSGQRGETPAPRGRRRTEPAPERVLPVWEASRHQFGEHLFMYETMMQDRPELAEGLRSIGPAEYYRRIREVGLRREQSTDVELATDLINVAEEACVRAGRPYYKVWPSILEALCHTEMRIDGEFFRLPYPGMEIRLPADGNPVAPATAVIAAREDGRYWADGREWSLVIVFTDGPRSDDWTNNWIADIPIRPGLSLEDALDQTALQRQCPQPELARRIMRIAVGVAFFGMDRHEVILPEVPRRIVDASLRARMTGNQRELDQATQEAREALEAARRDRVFGWKVGSEIDLPTATIRHGDSIAGAGEGQRLTAGHVRRGHMRMQPHGPKRAERKLIFVPPTVVRSDLPLQSTHGYRVRVT